MPANRILKSKEIAAELAVCTKTVYRWFHAGKLPGASQPGGPKSDIRMKESDVRKLLEKAA